MEYTSTRNICYTRLVAQIPPALRERNRRIVENCMGCHAPTMANGIPVCSECAGKLTKATYELMIASFRPRKPMGKDVQKAIWKELQKV